MVAMSKVKVGETYWSVERQRMGNTSMKREAVFPVVIEEVGDGFVMASWNGNRAQRYGERSVAKWKVKKPVPKPSAWDRVLASPLPDSREG
jgi:hypothetical protein